MRFLRATRHRDRVGLRRSPVHFRCCPETGRKFKEFTATRCAKTRTSAGSFDHLVGAEQKRCGKLDTEPLGAFEIDDHFEFHGPLDREVGRRGAFQNLVQERRRAIKKVRSIRPIFQQRARFRLRPESNHRQSVLQCQSSNLPGVVIHVIPAIPACPVRPKSGRSANARVYEYTP